MTGHVAHAEIIDSPPARGVDWRALLDAQKPVILRGLVRDWPIVAAGEDSPAAAMRLLEAHGSGQPVTCYTAPPEVGGRFFYNDAMTGMNFTAGRARLGDVLGAIEATLDDDAAPAQYIGSTDVDTYFPGFRDGHDLALADAMFVANPPLVSLWIGNRTTAATHFDYSNNIACNLVGRRRFTLFPPDQIGNLYPGPLEPTPGGQVVSLVDPNNPDFDLFPRYRNALATAVVADLAPGDALFYPAMWWHQVEALARFNVMMNYWWNTSPAWLDSPMTTVLHGLLSLRDRPNPEKRAWRAVLEHYLFAPPMQAADHIPERARGPLAPIDELKARRLRRQLLDRLNR
ncbi:cupin-like domain-containing protein [Polymorphobacter fuscus]|uniref:Cupin-like domain-containing protein n=1 Tax=Sandarakinorhabdus fusca TaxID=1439888 RepID=A0A7C9GTX9_9SPHN|nr:cupin-like domain-containing protein [Polymorphobacter fuscus]KAB7648828.1 cupin-like domain-containing protein [Polymorphobacter fuscus]MQT16409.1 cupin-like domain-containing protein [Polymorphobacter fuscus]NJC07302.1 hypothetical protein [Polymorphobacter fuscus]